ncbi:hypothetical protein TruAng_012119 [Truncatella angustata]|nr:hypothetical protein TruAng_012119 [Truncatella angustata]
MNSVTHANTTNSLPRLWGYNRSSIGERLYALDKIVTVLRDPHTFAYTMDLKDLSDASQEPTLDSSIEVPGTEELVINHDPKSWPLGPSSMFAPATSLMNAEFHNHSETLTTFTVSFFILGYVIGSLITAPLSEQFGRKVVLDISTAIFAIWQLACALAPNITSLLIFRLFAGLGGSACLAIGGGVVSDLFDSSERGTATAVFALGPLLGPVIGPIIGGFLSQKAGWRWVMISHID